MSLALYPSRVRSSDLLGVTLPQQLINCLECLLVVRYELCFPRFKRAFVTAVLACAIDANSLPLPRLIPHPNAG